MDMVIFEQWVRNAVESIEVKTPELRDLFAMNALNGILASPDFAGNPEEIAGYAYKYADAMLNARRKK